MDSRIARVTEEFFIRLLKGLRYDVFDVRLHESLGLMKRVAKCSGHNKECSRRNPKMTPNLPADANTIIESYLTASPGDE